MTVQLDGISSDEQLRDLVKLIARRGAGAERAMSTLYDLTARRVLGFARRFVPDAGVASEVAQDTFFQVWNQADRFDTERGSAMAWLLTIARSRALDARRKQSAQLVLFDSDMADVMLEMRLSEEPAVHEKIQQAQESSLLRDAIQTLTPSARQMIGLAFFSDLSHTEISSHLGVPLGTVKSTLRRALQALQPLLQQTSPGMAHQLKWSTGQGDVHLEAATMQTAITEGEFHGKPC